MGEHPFGAVIAIDGQIVARAEDRARSTNRCGWHAESLAIDYAELEFGGRVREVLEGGATLYASTEPCFMCCGKIHWSGINRVVFGCSAVAFRQHRPQKKYRSAREEFSGYGSTVDVIGPCLEEDALAAHKGYWSLNDG
jgi:tRNA(Arg) A34 adenosine deaminase TadA